MHGGPCRVRTCGTIHSAVIRLPRVNDCPHMRQPIHIYALLVLVPTLSLHLLSNTFRLSFAQVACALRC